MPKEHHPLPLQNITRYRSIFGPSKYLGYSSSTRYSQFGDTKGRKKYNSCWHIKTISPVETIFQREGPDKGKSWVDPFFVTSLSMLYEAAEQAYNDLYVELDFQENNDFELLTFLLDLDGGISKFIKQTLNDLRKPTIGGVQWSLLPLFSDLKSLANTVIDMLSRIRNNSDNLMSKDFSKIGYVHVKRTNGAQESLGTFQWRLKGKFTQDLNITAGELLLVFLDELGVHPDLRTVWDVIPFSFVADYFVPLGDILESLHPRGWFNPVITVEGGFSVTGGITHTYDSDLWRTANAGSVEAYGRWPVLRPLSSRNPQSSIEFEAPSPLQVFNTSYLSKSIYGFGKGQVSKVSRKLFGPGKPRLRRRK